MGRQENQTEIRRIRRLLRETVKLAEHASLTGSLEKGGRIAIRQYNHIRNHLQEIGAIPEELFQELDENDCSFDELGIVSGMLEGYLAEDEEVMQEGKASGKVQVGMVGLKELEDLKEIGKVIRESLPDFLRQQIQGGMPDSIRIEVERAAERAARHAEREAERAAHHAERAAEREGRQAEREAERAARRAERNAERAAFEYGRAQEMAEITNLIREVSERLRQPDLENGQREELLQRLDQLMGALQQAASGESSDED